MYDASLEIYRSADLWIEDEEKIAIIFIFFCEKFFVPMSGYDKMHQSLLDGQKVCLFIEAFSLHLYRAFCINGWLPYKLHSLKRYDDIKMKEKLFFCLIAVRINIFCIIYMHSKQHLGATKNRRTKDFAAEDILPITCQIQILLVCI